MLANAVEATGALISVLNGGFAYYNVLNINDQVRFVGLAIFEGGGVPPGEYAFTVQVRVPDTTIAYTTTPVFRIVKSGDINRIILHFWMSVQVSEFGMWTIVVLHDSRELAHLPVAIQQGVSGTSALSD
jgi:hypothetical protein